MKVDDENMTQCDECDGAGEICTTCNDHPENCECEAGDQGWVDCKACEGTGRVEKEEDEDDQPEETQPRKGR